LNIPRAKPSEVAVAVPADQEDHRRGPERVEETPVSLLEFPLDLAEQVAAFQGIA